MPSHAASLVKPKTVLRHSENSSIIHQNGDDSYRLVNEAESSKAELVLDYGRCEGGIAVLESQSAASNGDSIAFGSIYSETIAGIDSPSG